LSARNPEVEGTGRGRTGASVATRRRIVEAARELAVAEGFSGFTVERVAERAGVSRMTIYYQFGSKADLLEALFDSLAERGRMDRLSEAFREADPLVGLRRFIEVFCGFWASDPEGIRRLRSWAALEPDYQGGARGRDAWQREGLVLLVGRIRDRYGVPAAGEIDGVVDVLHALLSPEGYEKIARGGRSEGEVTGLLERTARRVLGLDA
jgi:AcrR family transcriptional regulator